MQTFVVDTLARAVEKQRWYVTYKDSLTLILVAVIWIAAFLTTYNTGLPDSVAVGAGAVGNFVAVLVTRLTPGAFTPSMGNRLEKEAEEVEFVPASHGEHAKPGTRLDQARAALGTEG